MNFIQKVLTILSNKKGLGTGTIKAVLVGVIFLTVLLAMLPTLIHTSQESVTSLATEYSNSTLYGTGASAIGTQIDDYSGYFWVIGPLVLIITFVLGVFMSRRR